MNRPLRSALVPSLSVLLATAHAADATHPPLKAGSPNMVVVSQRFLKGDYRDPFSAVRNAFDGDVWCRPARTPGRPCVIFIQEGVYRLARTLTIPGGISVTGAGRDLTLLRSGSGVATAVDFFGAGEQPGTVVFGTISDLAIAANGGSGPEATALAMHDGIAARVEVRSEGALQNVGCLSAAGEPSFVEVSCTARGGQNAIGLRILEANGTTVTRSTMTALGATEFSTGVRAERKGSNMRLVDTHVRAFGEGLGSRGIGVVGHQESGTEIHGGDISAGDFGVTGAFVDGSLRIRGTRIGSNGIGVSWASSNSCELSDVFIQAADAAVRLFTESGVSLCRARIRNSQLLGGQRALVLAGDVSGETGREIEIDHSVLEAGEGRPLIEVASGFASVRIGTTKLAGTLLSGSATLVCAGVYDGDYRFFASGCPTGP